MVFAYMVTRPRHASVGELWIMPTTKRDAASWVSDREPTTTRGDLEVVPVYGLCQPPSFLARA